MGLSWLLLTVGIGAKPTEFKLDTDSPDALCPELSIARDAVKKRLGQLEVEGGGTWHGRYSTVHDPAGRRGDYVRLVIVDPSGKEQATRELPMQGESCATMAQAIAIVVDGFFRDFGQTPLEARTATGVQPAADALGKPVEKQDPEPSSIERRPAEESPNAPPVTTVATQAPRTKSQPPSSESRRTAGVILGGGYESEPSSAAASFGLFFAVTPRWRIDLKSAFPTARISEKYASATAHLYPVPLRLSVSYLTPSYQGLSWFIGPEILVSLEHGSVSGIPDGRSGWRASFGVGGRTGIAYSLTPSLALATNVSTDAALYQSRRFLMVDDTVLESSRARLAGTLELWGTIFP